MAKKQTGLKQVNVEIEGVAPLLMHRGLMADPTDQWAAAISEVKGKTKAAQEKKSYIDFQGGLYHDDETGPYIPDFCLEKMVQDGAKKSKKGKEALAGVMCVDSRHPLIYDGPKDRDALYEDPRFRDRRIVVISRSRIPRVRPRFSEWALKFKLMINTETINLSDVETAIHAAGQVIGLGDYRPKFGRFVLKKFQE